MYPLLLSIVFAKLVTSNYLSAEANFQRSKSERSNIVNKGVWVRTKIGDNFEKTSLGELVFPPSDGDQLPSNFETDGENGLEEGGHFVRDGEMSRKRRSSDQKPKRHSRKSVRKVKTLNSIEDSKKVIPLLKPTPHENNSKNEDIQALLVKALEYTTQATTAATTEATTSKAITEATKITTEAYTETPESEHPKRRRKHNFKNTIADNTNALEDLDDFKKESKNKTNRNVFDEDDRIWHQSVPIPDTNIYEVVPKEQVVIQEPAKGITEKGLIKVLSMLTKTFKKIMRQHHEVKRIYEKLNAMNEDFVKSVADINSKFQDFDSKYSDMIQFNEKVKTFEDKIMSEEMYVKNKHKQMEDNMEEFENQQKKFLAQQKQFYTVQKVMLAQNEKINNKQISIAKTQSEISHKQNNFARILKKAKQMFIEKKNGTEKNEVSKMTTEKVQTTILPVTESAVKFNLFSIPTKTKLPYNQDEQIIKEKDERTVDDLVYKYYFNNTFIDNLMKSKILNDYASNTNSIEIARNIKNKREKIITTVLLPINKNDDNQLDDKSDTENNKRSRRWIAPNLDVAKKAIHKKDTDAKDPFFTMATSFCNEIGHNTNAKMMKRCVEKAMRRLKFMGNKLFSKNQVTVMTEKKPQTLKQVTKPPLPVSITTKKPTTVPLELSTLFLTTNTMEPSTPLYAMPTGIFFPVPERYLTYHNDNDELESNLKQYDLTPDTEGNVYYDGSLHLSDMNGAQDSGGMSDILPGLTDSRSKIELNRPAIDLKSKQRAFVKKMNEDIKRNIKARKL